MDEATRLLTQHGYRLVRENKHRVWRGPGGIIVAAKTPSDRRALSNLRAQLRRKKDVRT